MYSVLWRWKGSLGRAVAKVPVTSSSTVLYGCRFYVAECVVLCGFPAFSVFVFMFFAT